MLIGVYFRLFGRPESPRPCPTWPSIRDAAREAERAGFDRVVLEDALLYLGDDGNDGLWDPISMAAAIAASTTTIGIGHAVLNNPYHHPAILARAAATLDEVSGGRYTLGIGLGNTPDDYPRFGIPSERRYSRFEESIEVIAALVRTGRAQHTGEFVNMPDGELVLRGPRAKGPPIVIAAGKPRMMRLAARHADEWNWWTTTPADVDAMRPIVADLEQACEEEGRDPASLRRSVDLFSLDPPSAGHALGSGTTSETVEQILAWSSLGFNEVRVNLRMPDETPLPEAVGAMSEVVTLVHRG